MEQKLQNRLLTLVVLVIMFASLNNVGYAQSSTIIKVSRLYDSLRSHKIENPKTVLAIAMYETGWMKCKDCALDGNNLFGFRTNKDFLKFSNIYESIKYLKRWQTKYYGPWRTRNPEGTYYEYLKYIGYCDNMDSYIKNIKSIERWLEGNIAMND